MADRQGLRELQGRVATLQMQRRRAVDQLQRHCAVDAGQVKPLLHNKPLSQAVPQESRRRPGAGYKARECVAAKAAGHHAHAGGQQCSSMPVMPAIQCKWPRKPEGCCLWGKQAHTHPMA